VSVGVNVQRIESATGLEAIGAEWDRLIEQSGFALPFLTFSWSKIWWRHFAENRRYVRDRLAVRAVWDDGDLIGIAPLMLTERPSIGPMRVRYLRFLGADPNVTEISGAVYVPGRESDVYHALLEDLQTSSNEWQWIRWSGLDPNGVAAEILSSVWPLHWTRQVTAYRLSTAPTWETFRACLTRKMKKTLRNCYHTLARDGHEFVFTAIERPDEIPVALDDFFRLHTARARLSGGPSHRDVFETERSREFLSDVSRELACRSQAKVFVLKIGGQVVATRIGFIIGGTLYLYYSGYDPAWSKYSVMTALVAETIKYAISNGLKSSTCRQAAIHPRHAGALKRFRTAKRFRFRRRRGRERPTRCTGPRRR
jgi:CelD/BcsL family acetyltransferase involved in cellulose biosynthesis